MTYVTTPASIDNSGRTNVSVALSDWLTTTKPSSGPAQLRLRPQANGSPGVYRCDSGVWAGQPDAHIDLNACWIAMPEGPGWGTTAIHKDIGQSWPRRRATINLAGGTRLWSSRPGARLAGGGRKAGGSPSWKMGIEYDPKLEGQHGIRVRGDNCVIDLTNIEDAWCYGDGVYAEWWVKHTEIKGRTNLACAREDRGGKIVNRSDGAYWQPDLGPSPGVHHTGRQGIVQVGGSGLHVHDLTLWSCGRSAFDFEPQNDGVMTDVLVERVVTGTIENVWIASAGKGYVNDVLFRDCVNVHKPLRVIVRDTHTPPNRRKNWKFHRNRAEPKARHGSPLDCFRFTAVDGVELIDNYQPIAKSQAGRGYFTEDCTGVNVPNAAAQFPLV